MTARIQELSAAITVDEKDLAAAKEIREKGAADFKAQEAELEETISAIERAIAILEREMSKAGSASFVQLKQAGSVVQALQGHRHTRAGDVEVGLRVVRAAE